MSKGRFGEFGGQYVPETLMNAVNEVEEAYNHYKDDPEFRAELDDLLKNYAGRPSLLYEAKKMTRDLGGAKIYLKREDLNHTGAHKINNVLGQVLLAKKMGKTRVIAETGAGQHGVATATAAALMDMECEIYMGKEDTDRQALNVYRMELLGAKVHPVTTGTMTLKDAVNETMREWANRMDDTLYVLGSVMGPHPFPTIVRDFQKVISKEIKEQILEKEGRLPDAVIACVGGGSNAIGAFYEFIPDKEVRLIGCEAAGLGVDTEKHAATIAKGTQGIFHGMKSLFCQNEYGQIAPVYSISAGLDYPGIGPEHAMLAETGRAEYVPVADEEAVDAFEYLSKTEGIIPAVESAHAVAYAKKLAPTLEKDKIIVVNISGRGDKDVAAIMMTNPNTLGIYEENVLEISKLMHENGSLLYYDGANFNAIMGHTNPKLMGFDVVHLNLHKTFSTPHGGGGPGAGPVCVVEKLKDYLPVPTVAFDGENYYRNYNLKNSVGSVKGFYGNFGVLVRAYAYILMMGDNLKEASENAVLNANYLKEKLKGAYLLPYDEPCMHEFVLSGEKQKHENGVSTLNIAKALMDENTHPPTVYFPLIVHEAIMIEPTESETKQVLDEFVDAMLKIAKVAKTNPEVVISAPHTTPVKRLDETLAARHPDLKYTQQ